MAKQSDLFKTGLLLLGLSVLVIGVFGNKDNVAVNQEIKGVHVVVPFYDPSVKSLSEERRKFNVECSARLHKLIHEANDDLFVRGYSTARMTPYAKSFYTLFRDQKKELNELCTREGSRPPKKEFLRDLITVWKEVLEAAEKRAKGNGNKIVHVELNNEAGQEFIRRMNEVLEIFHETIKVSPVGAYLNWREMTMDGEPLLEFGARYMTPYNHLGPRGLMKLIKYGTKLIEKLV